MLFRLIAQIALKRPVLLRVRFRETQTHVEIPAQSLEKGFSELVDLDYLIKRRCCCDAFADRQGAVFPALANGAGVDLALRIGHNEVLRAF